MGNKNDEQLDKETCDSILETAKGVYKEEIERFNQIESKANITIGFSGVLFGAYLAYIINFVPYISSPSYLIYSMLFKLAVFISLIASILYFFECIKTDEYQQVGLEGILNYDFAKKGVEQAKLEIAATYKEAIDYNCEKVKGKIEFYNKGLRFLTLGLIIFAIHFLIEKILVYVS